MTCRHLNVVHDFNNPQHGRCKDCGFQVSAEFGAPWTIAQNTPTADVVNHPPHYTSHPSGIECIQVTEHMNFNLGNAVKYIWRADLKENAVEDLKKATWYILREIERRQRP